MTEDALIRQDTAILQSCTVVPAPCSCTSVTLSGDAHEVVCIKVGVDTGVPTNVQEIPEAMTFPGIKAEKDQVSYLPVCPLLNKCHQYP
jgi:hypothetical protein